MHTTATTGETTMSTTNMALQTQTHHRKPKHMARDSISLAGASQTHSVKDRPNQGEGMSLRALS